MTIHWQHDFLSSCRSLAVGHQYSSLGTQPILCGSIPGLVPKQLRFCRNYVEIMPSVAEGVKIGIQECQHQFRGRRWNCTTINDSLAIFGPVLDKGTVTQHTDCFFLLLFCLKTLGLIAKFKYSKVPSGVFFFCSCVKAAIQNQLFAISNKHEQHYQ